MTGTPRYERWYNAVWRWHFYAGLFCVPFVIWLSITGGIYLFKPQIEDVLYAPYRGVVQESGPMLPPSRIVTAGTSAVTGSVLHKYVLPDAPSDAVQILVGTGAAETRVWVHPQTGEVLYKVPEQDRFMRVIFRLHGELLAGKWGSALIEIAACWTIIMILTGLFLWWPRGKAGLAGTVWPRLNRGRRLFWRDMHAVTGIWVSLGAVFLIASGLPWANHWGDYLREIRAITGTTSGQQDWSAGSEADAKAVAARDAGTRAMMDDHAGHHGMTMAHERPADQDLNRVIPAAAEVGLAGPVEISPPTSPEGYWMAQSQAANRPLRVDVELDGNGAVIGKRAFGQRHWIDRAVGYGVAIHEGAWLGLANQFANLLVLIGLVTLCVSSVVLWWRRRPEGRLGAPPAIAPLRHSWLLVSAAISLALLMPLFGISLAVVTAGEAFARTISPRISKWIGLRITT